MRSKLARGIVPLITALLVFLAPLTFVSGSSGPSSYDWFVAYERLPQDVKVILEERASQLALEFIKQRHPPRQELIRAGLGQEVFEGEVYPVYHSEGAVYIFRGRGEVRFPDGDTTGVVLPGDERVTVCETWSDEALGALGAKRELPSVEYGEPSPAGRIYAGISTLGVNNEYFGVRATVNFPQFVDTSGAQDSFNMYTTHLVFTDEQWFESLVGQYKWWGGAADKPTAGFWVSWGSWQFFYKMEPSPGSHKTAEITTRYRPDYGDALMWVLDVDQGDRYYRRVPRADATTLRVTLLQEQIAENPVFTPVATFRPT